MYDQCVCARDIGQAVLFGIKTFCALFMRETPEPTRNKICPNSIAVLSHMMYAPVLLAVGCLVLGGVLSERCRRSMEESTGGGPEEEDMPGRTTPQ